MDVQILAVSTSHGVFRVQLSTCDTSSSGNAQPNRYDISGFILKLVFREVGNITSLSKVTCIEDTRYQTTVLVKMPSLFPSFHTLLTWNANCFILAQSFEDEIVSDEKHYLFF